jgi:VCBS repeat-containing protein
VSAADLLAGWTDVDGDALSVTGLASNHGSVTDNGNGTYTVTPTANYSGAVTLSYQVTDGTASVGASLGYTIAAVDDPGSITGTKTGAVTEDAATTTATGTLTLNDIDGPLGFVAQSGVVGTYGSFSIDAAGAWTYTLNNADTDTNALSDSQHPTESFTVAANDGATTSVTITINGHTDAPAYTSPAEYTGNDDPNNFDNLGLAGTQTITGNNNTDLLYGGAGNDNINGNGGDDTLYGGSGNDSIDGNVGNDTMYGGSGQDQINGSNNDDIIIGGYGFDTLSGGNGNDIFRYLSQKDTGDLITDFSHGAVNNTDHIDLHAVGATTFAGDLGSSAGAPALLAAHSVAYHYDAASNLTTVYVDTNGTVGCDMEIRLTGNVTLTSADFIF